jgi:hypothetical protein
MTSAQHEAIADIMDAFDFDKVRMVMDKLDWEWADIGIPDNYTIRSRAREIITEAIEKKTRIDTGGFVAQYLPEYSDGEEWVRLSFEVESFCTEIKIS